MKLEDLDVLIPQYASNKAEMDSYKKLCDKDNAKIKSIMKNFVVDKYETKDYKAAYIVSHRETINEEMLLEIAHNHGISEIIKTKEYIDFDALENALYNDRIPKDVVLEMDKAKEVKQVISLRVDKKKKEDD